LLLLGSIISGFGFIFLSRVNHLWTFYLVFIFLSVGSSLMLPVPGWTVVANWFIKKRGTALGILSASIGLGGIILYLVNWWIGLHGWRYTLVIIGVIMWVIGIPSSLIVRPRPEPYGMQPDGEAPSTITPNNSDQPDWNDPATDEYGVRQAVKTKAFWLIAISTSVSGATLHAVMVHVMPFLISVEFSREMAGIVASSLVFLSILGRFGMGWLTDKINSRFLLAVSLLLQAIGLYLLSGSDTVWRAIMFAVFFGSGYGGVITLRLTMQADFFGRKAFGSIQGVMMTITIIGSMSFPLLTGFYYDIYGSYRMAWLMMVAVVLATIPLALRATAPKKP
jgi:sugar phosphate permease